MIIREIGDKSGEVICYENLGIVYSFLGKFYKVKVYLEKLFEIRKIMFDCVGEVIVY